jgi:magnesium-transporting ATPase (P-type)
MTVQAIYH